MPENSIRSLFYDVVSKNVSKSLVNHLKSHIFATAYDELRAFSSAGLEHLPYKQRVGGSNPSTPTKGCSL